MVRRGRPLPILTPADRTSSVATMSAPTPHLAAAPGEVAGAVLLPGDPLRAEWIATKYLTDVHCYNRVRGMLGFTGTFDGMRVSVQGTGMGMPSMSIYATELFRFYGVHTAIRIGSCGALSEMVAMRDVIIAMAAHTDSGLVSRRFPNLNFATTPSWELLRAASDLAQQRGLPAHVGPVVTSDAFYDSNETEFDTLAAYGTLAVEMETAALYTIAAGEGVRALSLLTVSDHLRTHEVMSAADRELGLGAMVELALATVVATKPAA
jgi:purine-nucleoside phosphorylase